MTTTNEITAFNAGEISPELYGEVSLQKYSSSLTTGRNGIVNYRGGFLSRGGLAFVGRCKQNPPYPPRPIPFQFSITQGYILEFGTEYIRFVFQGGYVLENPVTITGVTNANPGVVSVSGTPFANGDWVFITGVDGMPLLNGETYIVSGVASGHFSLEDLYGNPLDTTAYGTYVSGGTASRVYTITTPYQAIDLPYLKYAQSADVMSLTCSNPLTGNEYPPYDLTRLSAIDWTLVATDFSAPISPPATVSAAANTQAPSNGVNATFAYVVTAVDKFGNESVASAIATCHGADLEVEAGTNTITWSLVAGAKYYNIYRSPASVDSGSTPQPVPAGSVFGFVGSAFGTQMLDTRSVTDLTQVPPTHLQPFDPGQILAVDITGGGSGQTTLDYTITTSAGVNFAGYPILTSGALGGFIITNPGEHYAPGDTIAFNGAGFASGAIEFGSTNPVVGDTLTLNGVVWTFVAAITGPQQTVVGGALSATLTQLVADLSASTSASLIVAAYTQSGSSNLLVTYRTAGTGGNAYTLAASRATPSGATLTGGSGSGSAGTHATGNITFSINPTAAQNIVLNGITWTFVASGASGNQTNLSGTLAGTLTQLAIDLNASAVPAIAAATYTATATALDISYDAVGAIGNTYTLSAGTTTATPSGASLQGGSDASTTPTATLDVGPTSGTYPGVNTYFQQRHFFANSLNQPDTFWASQTGLFKNFDTQIPVTATDAITASPWTEQVNGIQWLIPMPGGLIALTGNRAWQIVGEGSYNLNVQPITPSSTQAQPQAFNGANAIVPPVVIDYDVLYVEAIATVVRDMAWNVFTNIYTGADLTILSAHLFLYREILQWAWARQPYKTLWSACDDGTMLVLTYLKEQQVWGWTRCDTDGLVVGIASVTEPPVNAVYDIVQRFPPGTEIPGSVTFVMEAKENYDSAAAAKLLADTQGPFFSLDQTNIACSFDFANRNIMYLGFTSPDVAIVVGNPILTNNSGHTVFNGATYVLAPGGTANLNTEQVFWPQVCTKNLDTEVVTAHSIYDSTKTVPSGVGSVYIYLSAVGSGYTHATLVFTGGSGWAGEVILDAGGGGYGVNVAITQWGTGTPTFSVTGDGTGMTIGHSSFITPSDGTWRWIGSDFNTTVSRAYNGPNLINPRNGDFWVTSVSCEAYQLKASNSFAQSLAPAKVAFNVNPFENPILALNGIDATWCYCFTRRFTGIANAYDFVLIPAAEQSDETSAAAKLTYVYWDTAPFAADFGTRMTFGTDGNVYILSLGPSGTNKFHWRLTKFVPPVLTAFGANATGTMTDLTSTLWNTSGPNAEGANYRETYYSTLSNMSGSILYALCRLPATNQMAAVLKFFKEASSSPSDYTKTSFSCLYVTFGGSPAYDYHSGFVTGYMDSTWTSVGTIPTTGWAVMDCREFNNYLEQSDHVYAGVDYTKRWFAFQCYIISGGTVDPDGLGLQDVLVEYSFVSGSPPAVVTPPGVLTDLSWNAAYPAYIATLNGNNVFGGAVYCSTLKGNAAAQDPNFADCGMLYPDPGIYDAASNVFWLSGTVDVNGGSSTTAGGDMFYLDSAFTYRVAYNAAPTQFNPITPPFLKLSFGSTGMTNPGAYFMERMDNRTWQSVEDAYAVDAGVSNPMTKPATSLYASAASGTGVTFSTNFSAFTSGNVGDVLRMGGGIATITSYISATQVTGDWVLDASDGAPGTPFAAAGQWSIATPTSTLRATHIAGMTVNALADGVPIEGLTVAANGVITLPFPASNVKAGLSFTAQAQTPYLNGQQVTQGARKAISGATVRLAGTANGFQYGVNQPDGGAQNPQQIAPTWTNLTTVDLREATGGQDPPTSYMTPGGATATQLWTGDYYVLGAGQDWNSKGQVAIQQTLPVALEITLVAPDLLPGDVPEVTYRQDSGRGEASQQPQGPHRGMIGPRI